MSQQHYCHKTYLARCCSRNSAPYLERGCIYTHTCIPSCVYVSIVSTLPWSTEAHSDLSRARMSTNLDVCTSLLFPRYLDPQKHTQTWAELECLQAVIHRSTFSSEIFLGRCVYIHAKAIGYTQSLYDEACILYSCVVPLCNHRGKEKSTYTIYDLNPTAVAGGHWFQLGMWISKWSLTSLPSRSDATTFPISKMPL